MKYQDVLKEQFSRRSKMNPRYSLRAFAKTLGLEPSKLSEILSGRKGLSSARAEDICHRLRLEGNDREIFLLSVQSQHARIQKIKSDATAQLKQLLSDKNRHRTQTTRKNAWYFGAVKAVCAVGFKTERLAALLRVTPLQIESAERFIDRIQKSYPEKKRISYESVSLVKKIADDFSTGALHELDAEFLMLSEEQATALARLIQDKVDEFSQSSSKNKKKNLYLFFNGFSKLCSTEELC